MFDLVGPTADRRRDRLPAPDRLVWTSRDRSHIALRRSRGGRPRTGWLSSPFATGPWSDLRWGWTSDGVEIWERRWWVERPSQFVAESREARDALGELDVVIPEITDVGAHHVRIERRPWARRGSVPSGPAIRRFIEATLVDALHRGRIIRVGTPHIDRANRLLIEDVVGVERLETTDRRVLAEAISAVTRRDKPALEALLRAHEARPARSSPSTVAGRIVGGLDAEWNSTGFILALRSVASTLIDQSAPGSSTLWAFSDELVRRLDVAHRFPTTVLRTPERVLELLVSDVSSVRSTAS